MSLLFIVDLTELTIKDYNNPSEKKPLTIELWEKNRANCIFTNMPSYINGKGRININHLDNYIYKVLNHKFIINEII
tara:strand:- start:398 stop:628 length:231 start_codon:yes stop_codon:yes gene_type:complete